MLPHAPVTIDDLDARLVLGRPHVGQLPPVVEERLELGIVRALVGVVVPPRQPLGKRAPEHLAEVPGLGDRQVLDQAEQIGAGRSQRPANVVLGEPFSFQSIVARTSRRSLCR